MKKRTLSLLLALCLALTLTVPALAANVKCDVGNGVTLELPDSYLQFTPEHPARTLPDGTQVDFSEEIRAEDLSLVAMDETGAVSITVSTGLDNTAKGVFLKPDQIMSMRDTFRQEYEKSGYRLLDYTYYQHSRCAFVKAALQTESEGEELFILLYYTLCDGHEVGIALQAFDRATLDAFTAETERVVASVKFGGEADPDPKTGFTDVDRGAYYYDAVSWAVSGGVTTGTSATTFSPENACTRAQVVTFLWRASGSPKASGTNPFTDVARDTYYYDAVLWAVEKGITTGTDTATFSPEDACTRGQVVTFLWRANNKPAGGGSGFQDVAPDQYYYNAVLWAVSKGVTKGTGDGLFSPDATCTRGQIVTFLYRALV